ncbi:MAG: glycosyltransferase, partial [Thermodesulfovibrionales bacterium]
MHSLITFATQWGSKHGGINSFNTDFSSAFGIAYHLSAQIICIVASTTPEEIEDARTAYVHLIPLPYAPKGDIFAAAHAEAAIAELKRLNISFAPDRTIWLGHDRITGEAAIVAARSAAGRSALIHHMSYDHYESFAENSNTAYEKTQKQIGLFRQADLVLAVGPLLRDALHDRLGGAKPVNMLIPGLAEIEVRCAPRTFTAFLSGRLSDDASRIKQGHLGIAAFAQAQREARESGMPDALCKQPKLVLRGVDFESQLAHFSLQPEVDIETELKQLAEKYAEGVINLYALPYTQDRQLLFADLSGASVALMPSWHEGFGLVAWEAIAAGVPLIISKNSGVYCFLEECHPGSGPGCVWPIDVHGSFSSPYFQIQDLQAVVVALKDIANKPGEAKRRAGELRNMLNEYTWSFCAEQALLAFQWPLQKGSVTETIVGHMTPAPPLAGSPSVPSVPGPVSPLQIPLKRWKAGMGIADSQLLRAEEAVVPFNPAREPDLDALNAWLDDTKWLQSVRLITGAGGQGKTRLAIELCQKRLTAGWHAGFLDGDIESKDMATIWQALLNLNKPLLIVI